MSDDITRFTKVAAIKLAKGEELTTEEQSAIVDNIVDNTRARKRQIFYETVAKNCVIRFLRAWHTWAVIVLSGGLAQYFDLFKVD